MTYEALLDLRVEISKMYKHMRQNNSVSDFGLNFMHGAAKDQFKRAVRSAKRFGDINERQQKMLLLNL